MTQWIRRALVKKVVRSHKTCWTSRHAATSASLLFSLLAGVSSAALAAANSPPSLKEINVPSVANLGAFVRDTNKAILLGKALFWDTQLGSDGQACASCHFHAGADPRVKNQLSPGLLRENNPDRTFQPAASGGRGGPNYTLVTADFPFHQFNNPDSRSSGVKFSTNDIASSQGTFGGQFNSIEGMGAVDDCVRVASPIFHINGIGARKVEPRNTPTVINSVFNFRNFWDGRANNVFNGVDPFGARSPNAMILGKNGQPMRLDLRNSSLASQASGPPVNDFEMSCTQRTLADVGRKMVKRRALALQKVHAEDGVLKGERAANGLGLKKTYQEMIEGAFKEDFWKSTASFNGYTQMESNFSLFFGLALQMYQSTLISDQAPYDLFADGKKEPFDPTKGKLDKLTDSARRGLDVFLDKGKCINCHKGADFTAAGSVLQAENQEGGLVERMRMGDGGAALYDSGFYNIGVTPTNEDIGVGGKDPFGNPLSFSQQFIDRRFVDPINVNPCTFEVLLESSNCSIVPLNISSARLAVRGAFKTPGLRNVELTGPYMHNGGMASLQQVVEFYNRGGNFRNPELDPDITALGLSSQEKEDLVSFLRALTDPRVAYEMKPFDHPQLFIPHGHPGDEFLVRDEGNSGLAATHLVEIPAIGEKGRGQQGMPKLAAFLNVDFTNTTPPENFCALGRPKELEFVYTGQNCSATTNFQNRNATCSGDLNEANPVQIVVTKDVGKVVAFPSTQTVQIGDMVKFDNVEGDGTRELKADLQFEIRQNGKTLQWVKLKSDCSQPIYSNDRFGGMLLFSYLPK